MVVLPRAFLSPTERHLLDSLPANEADVIRALMDHFDATLVEDPDARPVEKQESLFEAA